MTGVRSRVTVLTTGEIREQVALADHQPGRGPGRPGPLARAQPGHWRIENTGFHVKDDSFGEDRHVRLSHQRGLNVSLLRGTAHNLLLGACLLLPANAPMTARAEWVSGRPLTILTQL